ncbi:hypothetical protein BGW36DRAFT_340713 [Talaromyces proteolyticus]|uniref:ER-bound oxygenase mpaB/mpaB'/Rubber oxygenase catalytic domain-containing protein n=1 Tax=Talaromyces proteolyticus TaxID=1131652 RepID=A0AAD4PXE0_9EURO|nr:uncharacterized protein BGW36DRAFT_340713 [Talaromyces proteolyticus]KAH8699237.1 hypothetical protein BGW36DRAFT_340713 [Talaromyces proteolyticus]
MSQFQNIQLHSSKEFLIYGISCAVLYLLIVASLRYSRVRYLQKKYPYTRDTFWRMTDHDAWEIQKAILQLEFPFTSLKSLQFALFRTYGIPTISSLLARTTELSSTATSFKRYADTAILIGEFMAFEPSSLRTHEAIARTKFLHTGYRNSGKILEEDMLYTLSLFALEPIRFIKNYEWRELTELERCALGTYWKSLGDALGISYECLPSGKKEKSDTFRDGLHWLEEIGAWSDAYEVANMKPHAKNKEVADKTTDVLVFTLPHFLEPTGVAFVSFIMDDRLRNAMMYKPPHRIYKIIFSTMLAIRRAFLRHLALPRPFFMRYDVFTERPNDQGRNFLKIWDAFPYYVKPTLWNRWGIGAWGRRLTGLPLPGDDGDKYCPQGYQSWSVGPRVFEGKGVSQMEETMATLRRNRKGGCPF